MILIVEDDKNLVENLKYFFSLSEIQFLKQEKIKCFNNIEKLENEIFWENINENTNWISNMYKEIKLILLDVNLKWKKTWFDFLKDIQNLKNKWLIKRDLPILMLTSKWTIDDKIKWLELWAKDFLVKPFNVRELELRIKNLLEKFWNILDNIQINLWDNNNEKILIKWNKNVILNNLIWNLIFLDENWNIKKEIKLTKLWINLILMLNSKKIVSRSELYQRIWRIYNENKIKKSKTLNMLVLNLNKKIWYNFISIIKDRWYYLNL